MYRFSRPRPDGWEGRLVAYIEANSQSKFAWGKWDCGEFAAGAIDVMRCIRIDRSVLATARGSIGFRSRRKPGQFREIVSIVCPMVEVPGAMRQRGDIVLLQSDIGFALGLVDPRHSRIAALSRSGIIYVLNPRVVCAWRA